jgi:hypothetical protein
MGPGSDTREPFNIAVNGVSDASVRLPYGNCALWDASPFSSRYAAPAGPYRNELFSHDRGFVCILACKRQIEG